MTIFIGADHGGLELKNEIIEYLQKKNIRVDDIGAYQQDPLDDYPDFAKKVANAVLQYPKESIGILICRNGVGMDITANRFPGIRSVLGFDARQIQRAREDDNANVLCLPAEYISLKQAEAFIDVFLLSKLKTDEKYSRRIQKLEPETQL